MKTCIICSCLLSDLNWSLSQKKNYISKCKDCLKTEKQLYQRTWYGTHKDQALATQKRHKEKQKQTNPIKARAQAAYSDCRKRAIKHSMAFDLSPESILKIMQTTKTCLYLGWELSFDTGLKNKTLASVDRIDSSKGYTLDNIQVISYLANLMKSSATPEELLLFASGILKINKVS